MEKFFLPVLVAILFATICGCAVTPPIVLHDCVHIYGVHDAYERMEKAVRDYGCEVDRVEYGFRNGTFIPMTMYGRRRTNEERLRRRLCEIEDEKKEKAQ